MKKLCTIALMIASFTLFAQERFTLRVQEGEDINSLVTNRRYLFKDFTTGTVLFTDGTGTKAQMNYDMITGEMHYKNASGNVLALSNLNEIASVFFEGREFTRIPQGFAEVLSYSNDKALLLYRRIKTETSKPEGAYGTPSGTSSVANQNDIAQLDVSLRGSVIHYLDNTKDVNFTMQQTIFVKQGKSLFTGGSENNFVRLFGKGAKSQIRDYVKQKQLDLKRPEDLIQLFNYCADIFDGTAE